jgi:hypothetical protein
VVHRGRRARPARHLAVTLVALVIVAACIGTIGGASAASAARVGSASGGASAPRIIVDTDLSRWWDDATAVGVANVLDQQRKVRLLGIVSDVPNRVAVAALDAIDTGYGHANLPLGAVAGSDADTFEHGYTDTVVARLPHSVDDSTQVPSAVTLYRRLLARQPDHSVTIVSLGGYSNLAGLLASKRGGGSPLDGRALIARKVARLVVEDGFFPTGGPAFTNQKIDLPAATAVVQGDAWPTPIAWVDGTTGVATKVGGSLCTTVPADHPMRVVYEALFQCNPPGDGDWDAPTLLYAVGDLPAAFTELGQGGAAVINDEGGLSWEPTSSRRHDVYVHVADQPALNARLEQLIASG